jgi:hypothetical protein
MNRNKNYDLDDLTITFASLSKLFYPSDLMTNPYWKSDLGYFHLLYMEYVFGVFIHAMFDNNYQGKIKMPRQPKEARYQVEAEADLWVSVWKMIKKINEYFGKESMYAHPAVCLYKLAIDGALILSTAYDERVLDEQKVLVNNKELGKYSITRLVRIIQTQNHELKNLEHNPFDERKTFTYQLINDAISLAGQSDSFRKGEWKAMVRSREKLVTVLREGELSNGVTLEHRGRPRRVSK